MYGTLDETAFLRVEELLEEVFPLRRRMYASKEILVVMHALMHLVA